MRVALNVCLALIIGLGLLWGMTRCNPFSYLSNDEKFILKGTVER